MSLVEVLIERSKERSLGITFIESSEQEQFMSYEALYHSALKGLFCLQRKGVQPKSELVLLIDDNKDFLVVFWACILGGIIPVPLSTAKNDDHHKKFSQVWAVLTAPKLIISRNVVGPLEEYLQTNGLQDMLLGVRSNLVLVEEVSSVNENGTSENGTICRAGEQDIAFVQFSSGSTGNPKGVVLTHANLIANVSGIASAVSYSRKDSLLSWMPLTHDMGMIGFHISPLYSGLNQYLLPTGVFVRNPGLWMEKVAEHKITVTSSPNFGYRYLLKNLTGDEKWDLSGVRIIYNGAEPISERLCREFNAKMAKFGLKETAMCPVYGLAEATVAVSISRVDAKVISLSVDRRKLNPGDTVEEAISLAVCSSVVNVGQPVEGCSLQITDETNRVLNECTVGRVRIKGLNVTSGYYNNTNAYKEIIDEQGWLNTGDLGFLKEGALYITGREKDILFINGQNFYAHDIEREAESVEGIELNKIVVVGAFNAESQTEEVIVFLLYRGELETLVPVARSLKTCIHEKLDIGIDKIVPVKSIPKTTSGKLQRFKLRESYNNGEFRTIEREFSELLYSFFDEAIVPAGNNIEERLLAIWKKVLADKKIGVETPFFHVGGNSLTAAELIMNVQREFQVKLSMERLYECQTVRALAAAIGSLEHKALAPVPKVAVAGSYPVSPLQRRIYYAWKMDPDSVAYNMPVAIRIEGQVDAEKLQTGLAYLVSRHDALRLQFFLGEEPRFRIRENWAVHLEVIPCAKNECDEKLRALVLPFDLAAGPLFRCFLLVPDEMKGKESILLIDFHHIISDGQAAYLFIDELLKTYKGIHLPDIPTTFTDAVSWQREQGCKVEQSVKQFWIDRFEGELPLLEIARDLPRPATLSGKGQRLASHLDNAVAAGLRDLCREHHVTAHTLFFTLYTILLAKYSGQEELIVGIPAHGRSHPDVQQVQGLFVNNLPIRSIVSGDLSFIVLMKKTSVAIHEAIDHQELAFDDLLQLLNIPSRPGRSPLFDTMFLFQGLNINDDQPGFGRSRYFFDPGFSKFDISLEIFDQGSRIEYAFEYSTQLFTAETILDLSRGFQNIIHQILEDPGMPIGDITTLTKEELENYYPSSPAIGGKSERFTPVHELFEENAKKYPDNIAIGFEGEEISYGALNRMADEIAGSLKQRGIKRGDLVAVYLKRSPELIAALLGILKSGAAYLPLDWGMPAERMKFIVENSGCKLLLGDAEVAESHRENLPPDLASQSCCPSDLAYVIYTSGTTGQPKGVMIGHGSLLNYIAWAGTQYVDEGECSFALYSSISFDLTVTSVFVPLVTGNKIVVYSEEDNVIAIESVIRENLVDIIKLTPSHLRLLKENGRLSPASIVKKFIVGGEALDTRLAKDVYEQMGRKVEILNEYGPTEATVGCMIYRFDVNDNTTTVPIGRPIAHTQVYLLDKDLKPIPNNVPGELYIGGEGLARGYLFSEELTRERFIGNPFIDGGRLYKTGDIAKRLPDGNIGYIGRNDRQVKINGNRVELGEIENQLMASGKVREVTVLADTARPGYIQAYFTPIDADSALPDTFFRNYLAERVPYFMIPKDFICLVAMPLTRNGKIDVEKLQSLKPANGDIKITEPRNETERLLARIWADVLNREEVGLADNFFENGGDSIKAVQISSRLFEEGISVKVRDILAYHTIENIGQHAERVSGHSYEQGMVEGRFAPTPIQRWFFRQQFENPHYYNQSVLFEVKQRLDIAALKQTYTMLLRHHDTLRVNYDADTHTFFYNNQQMGDGSQQMGDGFWQMEDGSVIPEFEMEKGRSLDEYCNEVRGSLNIYNGPLLKMAIIKKQGEKTFLFITAHHLIMDGISWRILLEDLFRIYADLVAGKRLAPAPKTASFKDWSAQVMRLSEILKIAKESEYWSGIKAPAFVLPADIQPGHNTVPEVKRVSASLDPDTTALLLKDVHKAYNTDVPILLNCALVLALHAWTGSTDMVIEQESHGRYWEELNISRTIGWFTTMYPVRLKFEAGIHSLVRSVKESLKKVPNKGIGYGICAFPAGAGGAAGNAQAGAPAKRPEVRINYLGQFGSELNNDLVAFVGDPCGAETDAKNALTAKLELNAMITGGELRVEISYDATLFKEVTISQLVKSFIHDLTGIVLQLKNEKDRYFTPSDFSAVDLDDGQMSVLFGD